MKSIKYFLVILFFVINLSTTAYIAKAVYSDQSTAPLNFTPEISIPNSAFDKTKAIEVGSKVTTVKGNTTTITMSSDLIGKYVQALYNYGLAIAAILAAIVLMGGGLIWLTSGGDSGKINKAKEMLIGSLSGLLILFCAWIILNTVNPALLEMKPINTTILSKVVIGCCEQAKDDKTLKMTTSDNCTGNFYPDRNVSNGKCESIICCQYTIVSLKYTRCFMSFPQTCSERIAKKEGNGVNDVKGYILGQDCSKVPECQGNGQKDQAFTHSCVGRKDGEAPSGGDTALRCYNGIIYSAENGDLGEPCGVKTDGYGICVKNETPCKDKNNWGLGGGRECNSDLNLKCCLD